MVVAPADGLFEKLTRLKQEIKDLKYISDPRHGPLVTAPVMEVAGLDSDVLKICNRNSEDQLTL